MKTAFLVLFAVGIIITAALLTPQVAGWVLFIVGSLMACWGVGALAGRNNPYW